MWIRKGTLKGTIKEGKSHNPCNTILQPSLDLYRSDVGYGGCDRPDISQWKLVLVQCCHKSAGVGQPQPSRANVGSMLAYARWRCPTSASESLCKNDVGTCRITSRPIVHHWEFTFCWGLLPMFFSSSSLLIRSSHLSRSLSFHKLSKRL